MPRLIIAAAFGGLLCVTFPAAADTIRITGGNLNFDDGDPPSFGFQLAEAPSSLGGVIFGEVPGGGPILTLPPNSAIGCLFISACFSGATVTLGATINGRGVATVGPVSDPENPDTRPAEAMFEFTTPEVALVGQAVNVFLLESPFRMTGWLRVYADDSFSDVVFEASLIGRGRATAAIAQGEPYNTVGPYSWEESVYRFAPAPVPEPATLTLLGIGLAVTGLTRRRRPQRVKPLNSTAAVLQLGVHFGRGTRQGAASAGVSSGATRR